MWENLFDTMTERRSPVSCRSNERRDITLNAEDRESSTRCSRTTSWHNINKGVIIFSLCLILLVSYSNGETSASSNLSQASNALDKGMQPLYKMASVFLKDVVQSKALNSSKDIISALDKPNQIISELSSKWKIWVKHYIGYAVCIGIGVVFILVMPLVGLFFCCCRCCGKCGGKVDDYDPKRARCKRACLFISLFLFNTLILAGVVCSFVTVSLAYQRFNADDNSNPIKQVSSSVGQYQGFLDTTYEEIHNESGTRLVKFTSEVIRDINETAQTAISNLMQKVNATILFNIAENLADDVTKSVDILIDLSNELANLTVLTANLTKELDDIRTDGIAILDQCIALSPVPQELLKQCREQKNAIADLKVTVDFKGLEAHKALKDSIAKIPDLPKLVNDGRMKFEDLKKDSTVRKGINEAIKEIDDQYDSVNKTLQDGLKGIKKILDSVKGGELRKNLDDIQVQVKSYGKYWYYPLMGLSGVMALIVALNYLGLLYGVCGHRPNPGNDSCCSRGVAANLFMGGVAFYFLFCFLFMLVTMVMFIPGGLIYTEVCRFTVDHNPSSLKVYSGIADELIAKSLPNSTINPITTVLQDCADNKGIYASFGGQRAFNFTEKINLTEIKKQINAFSVNTTGINVKIPQDMKDKLTKFGSSGFENISISSYTDQIFLVNNNLTSSDLNKTADRIDAVATSLKAAQKNDMAKKFSDLSRRIKLIDTNTAKTLREYKDFLASTVAKLGNRVNYKVEVADLLKKIETAETTFNKNTNITGIVSKLKTKLITNVESFIDITINFVENHVGKCRVMYDAIYQATDAVCFSVINPINGFWFSMGWCLFFMIPCLILAVKLAGLYRRQFQYCEDERSAMYNYGDGQTDTIPLTRGMHPEFDDEFNYTTPTKNSAIVEKVQSAPIDSHSEPTESMGKLIDLVLNANTSKTSQTQPSVVKPSAAPVAEPQVAEPPLPYQPPQYPYETSEYAPSEYAPSDYAPSDYAPSEYEPRVDKRPVDELPADKPPADEPKAVPYEENIMAKEDDPADFPPYQYSVFQTTKRSVPEIDDLVTRKANKRSSSKSKSPTGGKRKKSSKSHSSRSSRSSTKSKSRPTSPEDGNPAQSTSQTNQNESNRRVSRSKEPRRCASWSSSNSESHPITRSTYSSSQEGSSLQSTSRESSMDANQNTPNCVQITSSSSSLDSDTESYQSSLYSSSSLSLRDENTNNSTAQVSLEIKDESSAKSLQQSALDAHPPQASHGRIAHDQSEVTTSETQESVNETAGVSASLVPTSFRSMMRYLSLPTVRWPISNFFWNTTKDKEALVTTATTNTHPTTTLTEYIIE